LEQSNKLLVLSKQLLKQQNLYSKPSNKLFNSKLSIHSSTYNATKSFIHISIIYLLVQLLTFCLFIYVFPPYIVYRFLTVLKNPNAFLYQTPPTFSSPPPLQTSNAFL
jgi:hypothetical protein